MGILDRAIRRGIQQAVNQVVEKKVTEAVTPVATQVANQAAETLNQATEAGRRQAGASVDAGALGGAFASLQNAAASFATEAAKNMKICPACGEPAGADMKFCQSCGAKLPEETIAEGAVCTSCGKQNAVGTRFCTDCGAKLPSAIAEETAAAQKAEQTMRDWDEKLAQYPKWRFGGVNPAIEALDLCDNGAPRYAFYVGNVNRASLNAYRALLKENGFRPAGQYPSEDMLYKIVGNTCYYFESCEPFPGDEGQLSVSFGAGEPTGGFHYVKPEPKKAPSLKDLFNL